MPAANAVPERAADFRHRLQTRLGDGAERLQRLDQRQAGIAPMRLVAGAVGLEPVLAVVGRPSSTRSAFGSRGGGSHP